VGRKWALGLDKKDDVGIIKLDVAGEEYPATFAFLQTKNFAGGGK